MWAAASHAETIKVGVVLPYSGPNSDNGSQVDKAFDLYVKLHAKDLGDNKIELVKRDEGPPSGANARTVATELITNDKVKLLAGFVSSPSRDRGGATRNPGQNTDADCQRRHGMDHQLCRLTSCGFRSACGIRPIRWAPTRRKISTARPPPRDLPIFRPVRIPRWRSRPLSKRPAARSSTKSAWAPGQVPDFTPFFQRVKDEHPDCF